MPGRRNGGGDGRGGRGTRRYPEIRRRDAARLRGRPVARPPVGSAVRPRTARREGQPGVRRGAGLPGRRPVRHMPGGRRGDRRGQEDRFRRKGPQILPHPALHGPSRRGRAPGAYGRRLGGAGLRLRAPRRPCDRHLLERRTPCDPLRFPYAGDLSVPRPRRAAARGVRRGGAGLRARTPVVLVVAAVSTHARGGHPALGAHRRARGGLGPRARRLDDGADGS